MGNISPEYLTTEQFDEYCELIADGSTTRKAASQIGKARNHIWFWLENYSTEAQRNQYARSQRISAEAFAEKAIETAEDDSLDIGFKQDGTPFVNGENIQRSRLKVDVYKWIAAKKDPSLSDKQDINLGGQNGTNPVDMSLTVSFVKPV